MKHWEEMDMLNALRVKKTQNKTKSAIRTKSF